MVWIIESIEEIIRTQQSLNTNHKLTVG
jgi:hypothetical protein